MVTRSLRFFTLRSAILRPGIGRRWILAAALLLALTAGSPVAAQLPDSLEDSPAALLEDDLDADKGKSAEELVGEAESLMREEKLLDARTKLLRALAKNPKEFAAHLLLAQYYMDYVNHFRLAYRYTIQALTLFEERNGKPPYSDPRTRYQHAFILSTLSQAELNLDNYQKALEVLDEFATLGYTGDWIIRAEWYASSRAWILMKLGRLEEAIRVARTGALVGEEPGRILNMLAILLSMTGDKRESIRVFNDAIDWELARGSDGHPATPLNNLGEVFKELFRDYDAVRVWQQSLRSPDGCEHVLPSLNLTLLYIDQLKLKNAWTTMSKFESCVAQYALRNGEEHRALVHLARGRIAMHAGRIDEALPHLEAALDRRQWFGKIGTSGEDLRVAAMITMAQALRRQNNYLASLVNLDLRARAAAAGTRLKNAVRAWWLLRRAREMLVEELNNFEDLLIRHTDSLLEYPTLGTVTAGYPRAILDRKIAEILKEDTRKEAAVFYNAYQAEHLLASGDTAEGFKEIQKIFEKLRQDDDRLLKVHLLALQLGTVSTDSPDYAPLAERLFSLSAPAVRGYGLKLPVNHFFTEEALVDEFDRSPFLLDNSDHHTYRLSLDRSQPEMTLQLLSDPPGLATVTIRGADLPAMIDKLSQATFQEDL